MYIKYEVATAAKNAHATNNQANTLTHGPTVWLDHGGILRETEIFFGLSTADN